MLRHLQLPAHPAHFYKLRAAVGDGAKHVGFLLAIIVNYIGVLVHLPYILVHVQVGVPLHLYLDVKVIIIDVVFNRHIVVF